MQFADFLPKDLIIDNLTATNKEEVISIMADKVFKNNILPSSVHDEVLEALFKRERLQSTAVGRGIPLAIPHAHHVSVPKLTAVFARSISGVDFLAPDGKLVNLFFLILFNREFADKHLEALSHISRVFSQPSTCPSLLKAKDSVAIYNYFESLDQKY